MNGVECLHQKSSEAIQRLFRRAYPDRTMDMGEMHDMILWTPQRDCYPQIGTDCTTLRTYEYLLGNMDWINVCLFVNADFRACFNDAIMIEQALLQVSDVDYKEFREDMVLASDKERETDRRLGINMENYSSKMDDIISDRFEHYRSRFQTAGMMDAYRELLNGLSRDEWEAIAKVAYNIVYLVNAMTYNGVFNKYVHLVVDSVKKQLA